MDLGSVALDELEVSLQDIRELGKLYSFLEGYHVSDIEIVDIPTVAGDRTDVELNLYEKHGRVLAVYREVNGYANDQYAMEESWEKTDNSQFLGSFYFETEKAEAIAQQMLMLSKRGTYASFR